MSISSINDALKTHDPPIGFGPGATYSPPTPYCDRGLCELYATVAALAGQTDDQLALAVGAHLDGNPAPLAAVFAEGESFAAVLAGVSIGWRVDVSDGTTWVRDPSVRPTVQTELTFEGAPVSPAEYYTAGDAAGATTAELADALRELVDGDPSMFDAIMSAV